MTLRTQQRREIIKKELNVNSIIKKHNNKSRTLRTGFTTWTQWKKNQTWKRSLKNNSECKKVTENRTERI